MAVVKSCRVFHFSADSSDGADLVYTEFILVHAFRKLLACVDTLSNPFLEPSSNCAMSVKFLAQENNSFPLTGFEPLRLAIPRLLVRHVTHYQGSLDHTADLINPLQIVGRDVVC